MKKILYIVLTIGFLIMIEPVYAATNDVKISNVTCSNLYDGVLKENFNAEIDGLSISVDDSYFKKEGDYLNCQIEITNNSGEYVSIDSESISNKTNDNITYSITQDGENVITNGNSKIYTLDIKYTKKYTESKNIDNNVEIKLSYDSLENPNTGINNIYIICSLGILIIILGLLILLNQKKHIFSLILISMLLITTTVYAITQITITLNNKIIIEVPTYKVTYVVPKTYNITWCEEYTVPIIGSAPIDNNKYKEGDIVTIKDYDLSVFIGNNLFQYTVGWYGKDISKIDEGKKEITSSSHYFETGDKFLMPQQDVVLDVSIISTTAC
jgi:hypothetical protein